MEQYLSRFNDKAEDNVLATIFPAAKDDLIECDGVGCGCLLIHRSVFEKIKPPYFVMNQGKYGGEDFYFCRKAKRAGFKIYADPGVLCGHKPKQLIGYQYFLRWRKGGGDNEIHGKIGGT